jgi:hypothetical protein
MPVDNDTWRNMEAMPSRALEMLETINSYLG